MNPSRSRVAAGFTLIELIMVVVILAILAGVALPRFFNHQAAARESACKGVLGGVRQGIANYYLDQALGGTGAYPTSAQITTVGTVMQEALPENPYNNLTGIRSLALGDALIRWTDNTTGWAYYFSNATNPPQAIFWANSNTVGENQF